jgi:hypothetical protein
LCIQCKSKSADEANTIGTTGNPAIDAITEQIQDHPETRNFTCSVLNCFMTTRLMTSDTGYRQCDEAGFHQSPGSSPVGRCLPGPQSIRPGLKTMQRLLFYTRIVIRTKLKLSEFQTDPQTI